MRLVLGLEDSARNAPVRPSPVGKRDVTIGGDGDRLERDTDVVSGQGRIVMRGNVAFDLHENKSEHKSSEAKI